MISRIILCLALALVMFGCREVVSSDVPMAAGAAELALGRSLPIPTDVSNVQFYQAGETQNWDLYIAFDASLPDVEEAMRKEIAAYIKDCENSNFDGGRIVRQVIATENLPEETLRKAPKWWTPQKIKNGYFVGSTLRWDGPHYWVDTDTGRTFYYTHW